MGADPLSEGVDAALKLAAACRRLNERNTATVFCEVVANELGISFDDAWHAMCQTSGDDAVLLNAVSRWPRLAEKMATNLSRPFTGLRLTVH